MYDIVLVKMSSHLVVKLIKVHDRMRKKNPTMAEQDIPFVINRLCDEYMEE